MLKLCSLERGKPQLPLYCCPFLRLWTFIKEQWNPQSTVKPYDVDGDGTALGEGGAMLLLEDLQNALKEKQKYMGKFWVMLQAMKPTVYFI